MQAGVSGGVGKLAGWRSLPVPCQAAVGCTLGNNDPSLASCAACPAVDRCLRPRLCWSQDQQCVQKAKPSSVPVGGAAGLGAGRLPHIQVGWFDG